MAGDGSTLEACRGSNTLAGSIPVPSVLEALSPPCNSHIVCAHTLLPTGEVVLALKDQPRLLLSDRDPVTVVLHTGGSDG